MHGLIFETSVCYWQNQPGYYLQDFRLLKSHCVSTLRSDRRALIWLHILASAFSHYWKTEALVHDEIAEFFCTWLSLLRLLDTLHLPSARSWLLNTLSLASATTVWTTQFEAKRKVDCATKNGETASTNSLWPTSSMLDAIRKQRLSSSLSTLP